MLNQTSCALEYFPMLSRLIKDYWLCLPWHPKSNTVPHTSQFQSPSHTLSTFLYGSITFKQYCKRGEIMALNLSASGTQGLLRRRIFGRAILLEFSSDWVSFRDCLLSKLVCHSASRWFSDSNRFGNASTIKNIHWRTLEHNK